MERIFYNKTTSILFVTAVLLIVVLVCMLLTNLTQLSALKQKAQDLQTLIQKAQTDVDAKQELISYLQTDEYVIQWAEDKGLLNKEDISYIEGIR